MKLGILTFHLGQNHGGYLQVWCLQTYLKSLGHKVEVINYQNVHHEKHEIFRPWIYRRPFKLWKAWEKHRAFQKAFKKLNLSSHTTNVCDVDWNAYDAVIIGSDVVWDFAWDRLGHDPVYFGHFGCAYRGQIIPYAPSIGAMAPNVEIPVWVTEGLLKMHSLCARDTATATMVKRACGREAPLVVDPTWLDISYQKPSITKKKRLVVYAYYIDKSIANSIITYARRHGLEIISLGYYHSWADFNFHALSPLDWEDYLRESEVMVAGTFHGTLYAIRSQCRFVTVMNDRIYSRVTHALSLAGLTEHATSDPSQLAPIMDRRPVYSEVIEHLQPSVEFSRNYLLNGLAQAQDDLDI